MCYIVRTSVTYRGISIAVIVGFACDISAPRVCVCVRSRAKRSTWRRRRSDSTTREAIRRARARTREDRARVFFVAPDDDETRTRRETDGRTSRESNPQSSSGGTTKIGTSSRKEHAKDDVSAAIASTIDDGIPRETSGGTGEPRGGRGERDGGERGGGRGRRSRRGARARAERRRERTGESVRGRAVAEAAVTVVEKRWGWVRVRAGSVPVE